MEEEEGSGKHEGAPGPTEGGGDWLALAGELYSLVIPEGNFPLPLRAIAGGNLSEWKRYTRGCSSGALPHLC